MSRLIDCIPTGVQLGSKRFPDPHDRPKIKAWRCDLTALSQEYNLYFVACNEEIHVYQPDFPSQKLAGGPRIGEPDLILYPPVSPNAHPGSGIDHQDPHSITRLCVDYLGYSEVLLAACDDGDVVGYSIKGIHRATAHEEDDNDDHASTQSHIEADVRVLFHQNLGASAWGLAIHREARMIAISANTHKVMVLAWALTDLSNANSEDKDISSFEPSERSLEYLPYPRHNDHIITLSASTNIPSVAFSNNGDDPTGTWLFTSSIDGKTMLWNLRQPHAPMRVFQLGWCDLQKHPPHSPSQGPGICQCYDRDMLPHCAWGAMMLDTRRVHNFVTPPEDRDMIPPGFKDFTPSATRFSSMVYSSHAIGLSDLSVAEGKPPDTSVDAMELEPDPGSDSQTSESDHSEQDIEDTLSIQGTSTTANVQPTETNIPQDQVAEEPDQESLFIPIPPSWGATVEDESDFSDMSGDLDEDELSNIQFMIGGHITVDRQGMSKKKPYMKFSTPQVLAKLPVQTPLSPCLIITKEEIFLVQHPFEITSKDSTTTDPIFCMRRPLHPRRNTQPMLATHDRHCFFSQIPELGVFLVGSPEGRVGVFSTYAVQNYGGPGVHPRHGFQLEYLLPFKSGEETVAWTVPKTRLLGVAAGPVQGSLTEPWDGMDRKLPSGDNEMVRTRKWRVMMYFTDHTVLSFELSKSRRGGTPEVDDLIV